jgi:hypothetical protein
MQIILSGKRLRPFQSFAVQIIRRTTYGRRDTLRSNRHGESFKANRQGGALYAVPDTESMRGIIKETAAPFPTARSLGKHPPYRPDPHFARIWRMRDLQNKPSEE